MLCFVGFLHCLRLRTGFRGGSDDKDSAYDAGELGLVLESEKFPREENALYSSILVWKIPWTEEPGGLQSMGLQRVRHNITKAQRGKLTMRRYGTLGGILAFSASSSIESTVLRG